MTTTPTPSESYQGWNVPTKPTLSKYGLTEYTWRCIIDRQDGVCPVCLKVPSTGRGVIDHEHVRGWKAMPPEQREVYVRGVTCWFCNHSYLGRGITVDKALNAAQYLQAHAQRVAEAVAARQKVRMKRRAGSPRV